MINEIDDEDRKDPITYIPVYEKTTVPVLMQPTSSRNPNICGELRNSMEPLNILKTSLNMYCTKK